MQDIEKQNALYHLNKALAEAVEVGINLSVAKMYGTNDKWAIMVAGDLEYDPSNGGFHHVEIDE